MRNFPLRYRDVLIRLRVIDAPEVDFAEYISGAVHALQLDKAGKPYSGHPRRVLENARSLAAYNKLSVEDKSSVTSAAWLHDVVEDSGTNGFPHVNLGHLFGERIEVPTLDVVELLTRREKVSTQSLMDYYMAIADNPLAKIVKLADIADNLNEHRLGLLPDETQVRLREKYAHALDAVSATDDERQWLSDRVKIQPVFDSQRCPICMRWVSSSIELNPESWTHK
jgi:(p)ppGpp synthase/HD superfamily hydrolase